MRTLEGRWGRGGRQHVDERLLVVEGGGWLVSGVSFGEKGGSGGGANRQMGGDTERGG